MADKLVSMHTAMHGGEVPTLASGVPSLLGIPVARSAADLKDGDVAIIGIPQGAQASPGRLASEWSDYGKAIDQMRFQSLRYGGYLPEYDIDVFEKLKVFDCGNVDLPKDDQDAAIANVARAVSEALDAGCRVITLGGCVPTANYAVAKGVASATQGKVGTISFDAHGDCLDYLSATAGRTKPGPGTWQRRLWEHCQNVDPSRHVEIGMRGPRNVREMVETYKRNGGRLYPASTFRQWGVDTVAAEAFPHAMKDTARTWFSLCLDVLDIGAIPDWGDEPLGLSSHDVARASFLAAKMGVDVMAIHFIAPDSPCAQRLACYLCVYMMAGWIMHDEGKR